MTEFAYKQGKERLVGHRHHPLQEVKSTTLQSELIQVHTKTALLSACCMGVLPLDNSALLNQGLLFWMGQFARGSAKLARERLNQSQIGKMMACYLGKEMTQPKSSGKLRAKGTALQQNKASGAEKQPQQEFPCD